MSFSMTFISAAALCAAAGFIGEAASFGRGSRSRPDGRAKMIYSLLPCTDCGKCGFSSCGEFAVACAADRTLAGLCQHSLRDLLSASRDIWGYAPGREGTPAARVHCAAAKSACAEKFRYFGVRNCAGVHLLWNGNRECQHGCVGFGDCGEACPTGAIEFVDGFLPKVNDLLCIGCGKCVSACPFGVIELSGRGLVTTVRCHTRDSGMKVNSICHAGCISCQVCVKSCPHHAFDFTEGAPRIMADRCTNCGICEKKCPTGVIECRRTGGDIVAINREKCNLCGICAEICPAKAIDAEAKEYRVVAEKCIGCGLCIGRCPREAIAVKIPE